VSKPLEERRISLSVIPGTYNVLREQLRPIACWALGENAFSFGNSFVGRGAKKDFARFRQLRAQYPDALVALFGHTDPTGDDDFNHDLGGLRARAVYAVLAHDPDLWCDMYQSNPEALAYVKTRLRASGYAIPKAEEGVGPATRDAITRHIDELAGDMQMTPEEFLGEHGQYSMQSCSEFNPLRRITKELYESLDNTQRAAFLRANRRVLAFFFHPATFVEGGWPCPRPGEGVAACKARFWSDAKVRKSVKVPKHFVPKGLVGGGPVPPVVAADDLFLCRFYDRLAHGSGCERAKPWIPPPEPPPPPPPEATCSPIIIEGSCGGTVDPTKALRQLILMCSHSNHYNSGFIGLTDETDRIEVVPEDEDLIFASVVEGVPAFWSIAPEPTPPASASALITVSAPEVDPDIGFFGLMRFDPNVRKVEASWDHVTLGAEIHAYPSYRYEHDFEGELESVRDFFEPALTAWSIIGEVLADGIEVDLLDPKKCDFIAWGEWREVPGVALDYRAFYAYEVALTGGPLFSAEGALSVSLSKLLDKLKKIPGLKAVLDNLPEKVKEKLDDAEFSGQVGGRIDGPLGISRLTPDAVSSPAATGTLTYTGKFKFKPFDYDMLEVKLSFDCSLSLSIGLDGASEELILGASGEFGHSSFTISLAGNEVFSAEPFEGVAVEPRELRLPIP
jgi:hypothetical protein